MPQIRRLPEELVNRIAAGEVVERPASALKELVENAIDAHANAIEVRLASGGLDLIEVQDDGCGMTPEEMALALERHATSKLPDEHIEQVSTLGFRGEALPSIASVSRLTLESRVRGAAEGWRRVVDHGAVVEDGPAGLPPGSRIRVEELFGKVPARRKFLRTPRSEYAACLDMVRRLAMARPDVGFTLEHDGRRTLSVQSGEDLETRVSRIVARELAEDGVSIDVERGLARLSGLAGLPTFNRGIADHQYLFVNGRPVRDKLLAGAVRGAYSDMLARNRHAVLALFLELPPEDVDVNVHPAKTEVRFRDPAFVRGFMHALTWMMCGTVETRYIQLAHTVAGKRKPWPAKADVWRQRLEDELTNGTDWPLIQLPRERMDNFRDQVRAKAWSFCVWLLARHPEDWLDLCATLNKPNATEGDVQELFGGALGRDVEECEAEWRAWAARKSLIGRASGW